MAARKRWRGTTTERGLGWREHQRPRQDALRTMAEGQLCARCELRGIDHPMTRAVITVRPDGRYVAPLLDLDDFPGRAFGGPQVKRLSWRRCNRAAGPRVGRPSARWPAARRW